MLPLTLSDMASTGMSNLVCISFAMDSACICCVDVFASRFSCPEVPSTWNPQACGSVVTSTAELENSANQFARRRNTIQ